MKKLLKAIRWFELLPFRATDYFNNLLIKYEWCTSHRDRYANIENPKQKERIIYKQSTNNQGKVTKYRDGV